MTVPNEPMIASLLQSAPRAYATAAVEAQQEMAPESILLGASFSTQVKDAETRVRLLAEALALGHPELFVEQAAWWGGLHEFRGAKDSLTAGLRALRTALTLHFDSELVADALACVDAAVARIEEGAPPEPSFVEGNSDEAVCARNYLLAALEGRRADAVNVITHALASGMDPNVLREKVLGRAQAEVGRLWHRGELHSGEEHLVTRITSHALSILEDRQPRLQPNGRRVLCATVGGDLHEIGLRIIADAFEKAGWQTTLLGADVPVDDVVRSALDFRPDLIALSVNLVLYLRQAAATIRALRDHPETAHVRILVGGHPFQWAPSLHETLGADGVASNVSEGLRLADILIGD